MSDSVPVRYGELVVTQCEICGENGMAGYQIGCRWCARMFHQCCNSVEDEVCVECVEIQGPSEDLDCGG